MIVTTSQLHHHQDAEHIHLIPTKTYLFDQKASKILSDLRESFRSLTDFLRARGVPAHELDYLVQGQYYISVLDRTQEIIQGLTNDRQEGAKLLVAAAENLCRHTSVHYRNSCRGLQQLRNLRVGMAEMKREQSILIELGEQCVACQKRLVYIQLWQRRLSCRRATI